MDNEKTLIESKEKKSLLKYKNIIEDKINKFNSNKNKTKDKRITKNVLSFDIGSTNIKIVEGSFNNGKLTIENCLKISTPLNSVAEGQIEVRDAVTTMIGAALRQYNIRTKNAICTTNPTALINREIAIPKVEEDEIETVVRYEIQQYLPINLDDCILQTTIINEFDDEFEGKTKYNVRVIVYPKQVALEYYKLLIDLNLKPYTLDVNFNSLNKFINITNLNIEYNDRSSIALLDMGANFIDVNIYKGENLDFTRRIKFGGNDIDNLLVLEGAYELEEAKGIKYNNVDLTKSDFNRKVENKIVGDAIDEMIEKVDMILQFYRNSSAGKDVKRLFIFGGTSKIKGLNKYMGKRLGIKVSNLSNVSNIAFKKAEYNGEMLSDYANAIGAIIRL